MGELAARESRTARPTFEAVIRPRQALLRSAALSVALSAIPLVVALVLVSLPFRLWAALATIVLILAVFAVVLLVRLRIAFVGVNGTHVSVRSVLTPSRLVLRNSIDRIVLATVFTTSIERQTRELIALDHEGAALFRLDGSIWADASITDIAAALGVQLTELPKPLPLRELIRRYPSSRLWYERRSGIAASISLAVLLIAGVLAAELGVLLPL